MGNAGNTMSVYHLDTSVHSPCTLRVPRYDLLLQLTYSLQGALLRLVQLVLIISLIFAIAILHLGPYVCARGKCAHPVQGTLFVVRSLF